MSLLDIFKVTNNDATPILVSGPDQFLNDYLISSYTATLDLEKETLDCQNGDLNELIATLSEASLFAVQKIVIIKNPLFLTSKSGQIPKRQLEQLEKIFEHVAELTDYVIINASYEKLDKRKKLTKLVLDNFKVVETAIKPYEVGDYFKKIVAEEKYHISPKGFEMLLSRSDQVMEYLLSNYLKLKDITDSHDLSDELIDQNIDLSLAQNVFAILEAAYSRKFKEAELRLDDQIRYGSNPIQLVAVFESQLELIMLTKLLAEKGYREADIAKEIGVHPYRIKLANRIRLNFRQVKKLYREVVELEYGYKNGTYQEDTYLKLFLLKF
ncbi:MAG: DNA polymerase III subunit delta [Lactobacillus sp.]|nr:DNA polymerase III subunit delta [Lactobacillus sp.]